MIAGIYSSMEQPDEVKDWREQHPCDLKLYYADTMNNDPDHGLIHWIWHVAGRDKPFPFPYEVLTCSYNSADDHNKGTIDRCKETTDQSFTESEIDQSREYLMENDHFFNFHAKEVELPIDTYYMEDGEDLVPDWRAEMWKIEGYPLDFKVEGRGWNWIGDLPETDSQ